MGDGTSMDVDAGIWCTGFRPALSHLVPLGVVNDGRVRVRGTRAVEEDRLWLVGTGRVMRQPRSLIASMPL